MIYPASVWEQTVFETWLDKRMIRDGVTAMAFMRLCSSGKVPGLAPEDFPESDTVSGSPDDVKGEERRDEALLHLTSPGSATARPGPSITQGEQYG